MKFKLLLISFLFLGFQAFPQTGKVKRAIKALEKEKFEKAEKLLYKSLEKDSINTGAHYGFSLLFIKEKFDRYNIDSSYDHISLAIAQYDLLEEGDKLLKKLEKLEIVDSILGKQKTYVEELAFNHVLQTHTIEGYNYFIENYEDASQVEKAIELRNEIAYEEARKKNTYNAYKYFIDTYPEATQIGEASELYEFLLYENKTKSRTLDSYINFLQEHPHTNYTADALENILELSTINHKPESYLSFIKAFPQYKKVTKKALGFLYHLVKDEKGIDYFTSNYSGLISDSLKVVIDLDKKAIIPVVQNGLYGFKDNTGRVVINPRYEVIKEDYLCGEISDEFLEVSEGIEKLLISHTGEIVFREDIGDLTSLNHGLISNYRSGKYNLIHVAGFPVTEEGYDSVALLDNQYIKYRMNDKWGLLSFTGRRITRPLYDDIFMEGEFVIFEKYNKLGIANDNLLFSFANAGNDEIQFKYDDLELLNNEQLLVYKSDEQAVIDKNLQEVIPIQEQVIYKLNEGWLIKKDSVFKFYSEETMPISNEAFDSAFYKGHWVALKKADKWAILDQRENTFPVFQYDSLALIGNFFAIGEIDDSSFLIFQNGERKPIPTTGEVRVISALNHQGNSGAEILIINNSNNYKILYNQSGKQILTGQYTDINMLGGSYLVLEKYKRKGLADTTGNILIPVIYDGIGNYSGDYIITLKNQKFGMFHKEKAIDISPQYDVILKSYNDSLYIASKDRRLGLINKENQEILPFKFDEIRYWNDSLALVKNSNEWHIYNTKTQLPLLENIVDIEFIGSDSGVGNKQAIILKNNNYGVISSKKLELLTPVYDDIYNLGTIEHPVYFAEKRVKEADLYVVLYYNELGEVIHKQTFTEENYDQIYCY